jgi:hypothetical protein
MLELTILTKKFWKEGFAVGNIYSRLTTYIMVLIPGSFLVLLPIICSFVTFFLAAYLTPTIFFAIAFAEFTGMSIIVILQK